MKPSSAVLSELLNKLAGGEVSVHQALERIEKLADPMQRAIEGATVDLGRQARCGFAEVIYGEGKSADLIKEIIKTQLAAGQTSLVTRIDAITAQQIRSEFSYTHHNAVGHTLCVANTPLSTFQTIASEDLATTPHAAVVTAGSTDGPIAEEAIDTLHWMGIPVQKFVDIGVAGPQRLLAAVPNLRLAAAVVVIAGMEGALPSAIAGHLAAPVFAVPTSVGYGASFGGITPLLGMLNSCAANVAVVNIDAGFKAAYLAGLIVRQLQQQGASETP
jgi:NCAIR mutase (PurE)-related protein